MGKKAKIVFLFTVLLFVFLVFWLFAYKENANKNANRVAAIATAVLAVGGLIEGYFYIRATKRRNTLDRIIQLQTDPILYNITVLIAEKARKEEDENGNIYDFSKLKKTDKVHVIKLLAAYESMALSVREGIIEESLLRKEFTETVLQLVILFLPMDGHKAKAKLFRKQESEEYFPSLICLFERWKKSSG